jgi:hypothetical protein
MGHAARRLHSATIATTAALYTVSTAFIVLMADLYNAKPPTAINTLMTLCLATSALGGTIQAFMLRRRVFAPRPDLNGNLAAIQTAKFRRELRARAKQIARDDPALAFELRIGRPDLTHSYNDGGVIDVNHAPKYLLITVPGISPTTAEQIIEHREHRGPFVSAEDIAAAISLNPNLVSQIAEYTVYLSRH